MTTIWIELFKHGFDTWITGPFVPRDDDEEPEFSGSAHKALKLTGRPDIASFGPGMLYNETSDTVGPLPAPGPAPPLEGDEAVADALINKPVWAGPDTTDALKLILKKLYF